MKSLFISLCLLVCSQFAQAAPVELNEWQSKKLYNILASFGLRTPNPPTKQTNEWAHPAQCIKVVNGGVSYACLVHDQFHNVNVQRTGALAKKLYDMINLVNPALCGGDRCTVRTPDIKCIYYWPNKHHPPLRRYWCAIEKYTPESTEN